MVGAFIPLNLLLKAEALVFDISRVSATPEL